MSRVAIVGGHGHVALQLHPLLRAAGHTPVALVRREDYRDELEALGAEVRLLDIEAGDLQQFVAAFEGCDAVVFAAGGGADGNIERKKSVDLGGSLLSIEAAQQVGITRFVQVSAWGVDEPLPDDVSATWKAYVEAKAGADAALRDSGLDWTVVRPGRLTHDAATGRVLLGSDTEIPHDDPARSSDPDNANGDVTRADVAAVVAAVLDADHTIGVQLVVVGGDVPVAEAVAGLSG
ncbi:NAD(P)H-binding protein [Nocardioides sp.]|uniref:NAD(P)H-binding protein n=1 Tax=Nocardioides sp. TaxID=35761 RepID=UPI00271B4475|nr:NAD(P)H-binding protein [Nocardioides sp.]MDO9457790.1 NAD(P)H-binding protein [Nocardioides sp.]